MKTLRFFVFTFLFTIFVGLPLGFAQDADIIDISLITQEEDEPVIDDSERLVRLIYFIPNDRKPQPYIDAKLDELIKETQQFYADEMERHGHSRKSFRFEADENGNAIVHHVNGQFDDAYYQINPSEKIEAELRDQFDYHKAVYLISVEISSDTFDNGAACGYGGSSGFGGYAYIPASGHCFEDATHTAHELGHAFGLEHDFRNQSNIMSYGWIRNELSECAASNLHVHPFFNPDKVITRNYNTRIKLLSSKFDATPPHALRLRFEINDPDGLVQAQLLTKTTGDSVTTGFPEIATCKVLRGVSENVDLVTTKILNDVLIHVTDKQGNSVQERFDIDFTALTPETGTIHIPDAGLAAAIREHFDYPPRKQITSFDMARLPYLNAPGRGISDLTGLEHAVAIEYLDINNNKIQDLTPILALPELRKIDIAYNPITDLTQVSELTQLTRLIAGGNQSLEDIKILAEVLPLVDPSSDITSLAVITPLVDITFLAKLTQLTELVLDGNQITDVTPLVNLTQLETLFLGGNQITDVTPLVNLTQLTWLQLNKNQIRDITPLKNMTRLLSLNLQFNQISDTRPLKGLVELRRLYIDNNPLIDDITGLEDMTQLKYLQLPSPLITDITPLRRLTNLVELYVGNNQVRDIAPLTDMTKLKALQMSNNQISDISPLANLTQLYELGLANNQITDISPLAKLTQLQDLVLAKNQITNTRPLMGLVNLKNLSIWGNPIADLQPLLTLKRRAPGIKIWHVRRGEPLPVTLSSFKAVRTADGAILNWTTESELDNAGFNILRSRTKTGEFQKINVKLIQGAGTTGERSTYSWTDTTAKPNTVYYYQIEDVSHAGERKRLATVRLRGFVSARGKLMTKWADLK